MSECFVGGNACAARPVALPVVGAVAHWHGAEDSRTGSARDVDGPSCGGVGRRDGPGGVILFRPNGFLKHGRPRGSRMGRFRAPTGTGVPIRPVRGRIGQFVLFSPSRANSSLSLLGALKGNVRPIRPRMHRDTPGGPAGGPPRHAPNRPLTTRRSGKNPCPCVSTY